MTRIVVTGDDSQGVSKVVRDEELKPKPGNGLFAVWAYNKGPVNLPSGVGDGQEFDTHFPPENGLRVYAAQMRPGGTGFDRTGGGQAQADLAESMSRGGIEGRSPGFHISDTVDVGVIVSGEMGLELEDGSITSLRQGDVVIQNGTNHAWHPNQTDGCSIVWVLVGATRDGS
jgi:hypothetical protein